MTLDVPWASSGSKSEKFAGHEKGVNVKKESSSEVPDVPSTNGLARGALRRRARWKGWPDNQHQSFKTDLVVISNIILQVLIFCLVENSRLPVLVSAWPA
jgi:hypothetical protein